MEKNLDYYMGLKYPIELTQLPESDGGDYFATIPQLGKHAFIGDGKTIEEAIRNLNEAKKFLFEEFLKEGVQIPEPISEEEEAYSGKFMVRIPKTLHSSLAKRAKQENVSLNQLVTALLASGLALKTFEEVPSKPQTFLKTSLSCSRK